MVIRLSMQQKLLTKIIKPNKNISFPIGTILAVKGYYKKLNFPKIFGKFKKRGLDLNSLTQGLLSYKLTENFSISKASDWINRKQVLDEFELKSFHEKTLFRTLGIIGDNREEIIANIQTNLFNKYNFKHTNCNVDWTSLVIWGEMCKLAKHGFSKDHRPDKKQISLGISEIASPINIPIGITIESGNTPDMKHFSKSYNQIKNKLKPNSRITFDKGANSKENIEMILAEKMRYLTAKKLNKSEKQWKRDYTHMEKVTKKTYRELQALIPKIRNFSGKDIRVILNKYKGPVRDWVKAKMKQPITDVIQWWTLFIIIILLSIIIGTGGIWYRTKQIVNRYNHSKLRSWIERHSNKHQQS